MALLFCNHVLIVGRMIENSPANSPSISSYLNYDLFNFCFTVIFVFYGSYQTLSLNF
jgi:hypothetical protein